MTVLVSTKAEALDGWCTGLAAHLPDEVVKPAADAVNDPTIEFAVLWQQPGDLIANLPNLKAIFSLGAGVDHILRDTNLPDVPIVRVVAEDLTSRMSEYVVWRVLDHFRQGRLYREQQSAHLWSERPQLAAGAVSVGILGMGELGQDAAKKLQMLGFNVCGWSRSAKEVSGVKGYSGAAGLQDCLAASDIVVVLLPLTAQTRGLIDNRFLSAMKRKTPLGGPVLINAGRGGLQKSEDILAALSDGRLMEASLDVFEQEPLPSDSPFWAHPRVFVTPHAAAASDPGALARVIAGQIKAYRAGKPLSGIVDRQAGY
ncbi:glyoxylate/hydroxypyruvate reductase A [Aureimonas fodinaquatilis]|uniref:Glyoxylate/hydroxypyruvate reductase A n=1 Tax=Aureimonas fodinaquatilis TaxID=2565783 RepID=A0A5B0E208_9HYPH|nr:glyoxylate/hydroxypyruvate reductase A [Aureimonas fodinaquatilis]KAA0972332.1 glyoxylate/hydroxypyruvate reductase A [Aureimonas fodinaquatilis]